MDGGDGEEGWDGEVVIGEFGSLVDEEVYTGPRT